MHRKSGVNNEYLDKCSRAFKPLYYALDSWASPHPTHCLFVMPFRNFKKRGPGAGGSCSAYVPKLNCI